MIYEFESPKQHFMQVLTQAIIDDGTFSMISSNTTNDRVVTANCSDGYVFQSSENINGKKFIFTLKNITLDNSAANTQINIMVSRDYTPSATPDTNGVFTSSSARMAYYLTSQANLTLDAIIKIHLDIKPHRIILITYNAVTTIENPSLLYIGYPNLSTNIERYNMQNLMILGTNTTTAGPSVAMNVLGTAWQMHTLYSLVAPTNPNIAGDYNISPIFIGTATEGVYGILDDIWVMPFVNITQLDELEQNGNRYKVFRLTQAVGSNGFAQLGTLTNLAFAVKVVRL